MRRWQLIGIASLAVLLVAYLSAPWVAGRIAVNRARARGVELTIGSVRFGWGKVWLRDAEIRPIAVPKVTARLDAVQVDLGWTLSPKRVSAVGGELSLSGAADETVDALSAWKQEWFRNPTGNESNGSERSDRALSVSGLRVAAVFDAWSAQGWGISLWRDASGEGLAFDLIRIEGAERYAEASDGRLVVETKREAGRRIRELSIQRLGAKLGLGASASTPGGAASAASAGQPTKPPTPVASASASNPPSVGAGSGTPPGAPGSPTIVGLYAERKAQLDRATATLGGVLAEGASLAVQDVSLELGTRGTALHLGPAKLSLNRKGAVLEVVYRPLAAAGGAEFSVDAELGLVPGPARFRATGGPVPLSSLGIREGNLSLLSPARSMLTARTEATLSADGKELTFSANGSLDDLAVHHPALAPEPVVGIDVAWRARGKARLDGSYLRLENASLRLGETSATLDVELLRDAEHTQGLVHASVPLASCQAMLDSTPRALVPLIKEMEFSGSFSFDAGLVFDTRKPADFQLKWDIQNECEIAKVPPATNPKIFHSPFRYQVEDVDGKLVYRETGPETPNWTPFTEMSRHLETGVIVCEDSRFWVHSGFDPKAINEAIHDNIRAGRFVRGASTISMQLAKNLYLGREKTLSRKLQEAVLTMLLEQELRKDEILELYFNVIEYAPGVFGIADAAKYYFGSEPRDLSLGQSLYLASILPSPSQSHFKDDGTLSEGWTKYLRQLMSIAHKIGRVNDAELEEGLLEELKFGEPYVPGTPAAPGSPEGGADDSAAPAAGTSQPPPVPDATVLPP